MLSVSLNVLLLGIKMRKKEKKLGMYIWKKKAKSYLPLTLWNRYTVLLHHAELYQDLPIKSGFKHLNTFAMNLFNIT